MRIFWACMLWCVFSFSAQAQYQIVRVCHNDSVSIALSETGNTYWYFRSAGQSDFSLISTEDNVVLKHEKGELFGVLALDSCNVIVSDTMYVAGTKDLDSITGGNPLFRFSTSGFLRDDLRIFMEFPQLLTDDYDNPDQVQVVATKADNPDSVIAEIAIDDAFTNVPLSLKYMDAREDEYGDFDYAVSLAERILYEGCDTLIQNHREYNMDSLNSIYKLPEFFIFNEHLLLFKSGLADTIRLNEGVDNLIGIFNMDNATSQRLQVDIYLGSNDKELFDGYAIVYSGQVPGLAPREGYFFADSTGSLLSWPSYLPSGNYNLTFEVRGIDGINYQDSHSFNVYLVNTNEHNVRIDVSMVVKNGRPFLESSSHLVEITVENLSSVKHENLTVQYGRIYNNESSFYYILHIDELNPGATFTEIDQVKLMDNSIIRYYVNYTDHQNIRRGDMVTLEFPPITDDEPNFLIDQNNFESYLNVNKKYDFQGSRSMLDDEDVVRVNTALDDVLYLKLRRMLIYSTVFVEDPEATLEDIGPLHYDVFARSPDGKDTVRFTNEFVQYPFYGAEITKYRTSGRSIKWPDNRSSWLETISIRELREQLPYDTVFIDYIINRNHVNTRTNTSIYSRTWQIIIDPTVNSLPELSFAGSAVENASSSDSLVLEIDSIEGVRNWTEKVYIVNESNAPSPVTRLAFITNESITREDIYCSGDIFNYWSGIPGNNHVSLGFNEYFDHFEKIFEIPSIAPGDTLRVELTMPYTDTTGWYILQIDPYNELTERNEYNLTSAIAPYYEHSLQLMTPYFQGHKTYGMDSIAYHDGYYYGETGLGDTLHMLYRIRAQYETYDSTLFKVKIFPIMEKTPFRTYQAPLSVYDKAFLIDSIMIPPLEAGQQYNVDVYFDPAQHVPPGSSFQLFMNLWGEETYETCYLPRERFKIDYRFSGITIREGDVGVTKITGIPDTLACNQSFDVSIEVSNHIKDFSTGDSVIIYLEDNLGFADSIVLAGIGPATDAPWKKTISKTIFPYLSLESGLFTYNLKATLDLSEITGDEPKEFSVFQEVELTPFSGTPLTTPVITEATQHRFAWEAVSGASTYHIQITDDAGKMLKNDIVNALNYTPRVNPYQDDTLIARIRALDPNQCRTSSFATKAFLFKRSEVIVGNEGQVVVGDGSGGADATNLPPVILSPTDGSTSVAVNMEYDYLEPYLLWANRSKGFNKISIMLGTSPANLSKIKEITLTRLQANRYVRMLRPGISLRQWVLPGVTYYVRIDASNGEETLSSSTIQFTTVDLRDHVNHAPSAPEIEYPEDNAIVTECHRQLLIGYSTDPDGEEYIGHLVKISKSPDFTDAESVSFTAGTVGSFFQYLYDMGFGKYYWKACGVDQQGVYGCTPVRVLEYVENTDALKPHITYPHDGDVVKINLDTYYPKLQVNFILGEPRDANTGFGDQCWDDFTYEKFLMQDGVVIDTSAFSDTWDGFDNGNYMHYTYSLSGIDKTKPVSTFMKVTAQNGTYAYSDTLTVHIETYGSSTDGGDSGGSSGGSSGGDDSGSGDGGSGSSTCWENVSRTYVDGTYDTGESKLRITITNPHDYEVYYRYSFQKKDGGWESGSWWLGPGETTSTYSVFPVENCFYVFFMRDEDRGTCVFPDESRLLCD